MKQNDLPFVIVFVTVGAFTFMTGSIACFLAAQPHLSLLQTEIFDTCQQIWETGATAMFAPLIYRILP